MSLGYRRRKKQNGGPLRAALTLSTYSVDGFVLRDRRRRRLKTLTRAMSRMRLERRMDGTNPTYERIRDLWTKAKNDPLLAYLRPGETTNLKLETL